jgi:hypothetical protein
LFFFFCFSIFLWCILHSICIPEYFTIYLFLKINNVLGEKNIFIFLCPPPSRFFLYLNPNS